MHLLLYTALFLTLIFVLGFWYGKKKLNGKHNEPLTDNEHCCANKTNIKYFSINKMGGIEIKISPVALIPGKSDPDFSFMLPCKTSGMGRGIAHTVMYSYCDVAIVLLRGWRLGFSHHTTAKY